MLADKEIVDLVPCRFCGVTAGRPCQDTRTGKLTKRPHPSRQNEAGWAAVGEDPPGPWDAHYDFHIFHD